MASREEEKRKRREERMAIEAAERSQRERIKRIQYLLGGLLAIAVVVGVVIAVTSGGGGGSKPHSAGTSTTADAGKIPPASDRNLASAAKAAGCVLLNPALEGATHVTGKVHYKSNPPTSGNHNVEPSLDGLYDPGQEPAPEHYVHTLEHGRIEVQYRPGSPAHLISQLATLVSEPLNGRNGYKTLLFENNTKMPYAVAATSWGHLIGCPSVKPAMWDALRDFRTTYVDKGPETGFPPNN